MAPAHATGFGPASSLGVMEKLDMRREGLLRSHIKERGERIDEVFYGILREEWEARRSQ